MKKFVPLVLFLLCALLFFIANHYFFNLLDEQLFSFFKWFLIQSYLSLIVWPTSKAIFENIFSPRQILVANVLFAPMQFLFIHWMVKSFGGEYYLSLIFLALLNFLILILYKQKFYKQTLIDFINFETIKFAVFITLLVIISTHSYLQYGEKAMDFNLINFLSTNQEWRLVEDPWASGVKLSYYYFGHFLYGQLISLSDIKPSIGYNLALATIYLQFICAIWLISSFYQFKRYEKVCATLIVAFGSNLATLINFFATKQINYNFFWSNSRIFSGVYFSEFPFWSFLWGDLHPHYISYPMVVFCILLVLTFLKHIDSFDYLKIFLVASIMPLLIAVNAWDAIYLTIFTIIAILYYRKFNLKLLFAVIVFVMFAIPNYVAISGTHKLAFHFNFPFTNTIWQIFKHQGLWWIVSAIFILTVSKKKNPIPMVIFYFALIILAELTTIMDKLNTIFKTYNIIWIVGALMTVILISKSSLSERMKKISFTVLLIVSLSGSIMNFYAMASSSLMKSKTLDGMLYLEEQDIALMQMIAWTKENIPVNKRILSKYSASYDYSAIRFSAATGNPTIINYDGHLYSRGLSQAEVNLRKKIVDSFYQNRTLIDSYQNLKKYSIDYFLTTQRVSFKEKYLYQEVAAFGPYVMYKIIY